MRSVLPLSSTQRLFRRASNQQMVPTKKGCAKESKRGTCRVTVLYLKSFLKSAALLARRINSSYCIVSHPWSPLFVSVCEYLISKSTRQFSNDLFANEACGGTLCLQGAGLAPRYDIIHSGNLFSTFFLCLFSSKKATHCIRKEVE